MHKMFNKKTFLWLTSILIITGIGLLSGCTVNENSMNDSVDSEKSTTVEVDNQRRILADFKTLLGNNPELLQVITFIDKNISNVSKEMASAMVTKLEEIQIENLPKLEEKYYRNETIQKKMNKEYMPGFDINKIDHIQDNELKALLVETRDKGYKVETSEGIYMNAVNNNKDSEFMKLLGKYMDILEKTNYKLTDEVEKFRKNAVDSVR